MKEYVYYMPKLNKLIISKFNKKHKRILVLGKVENSLIVNSFGAATNPILFYYDAFYVGES